MTTVAETVRDALSHLQVVDAVQPVKPQDMSDGIRALNQMMARWEADGVSLGWVPVSNPSDTLPVPPEAEETIAYNLALRMSARYGGEVDPVVAGFAGEGLLRLLADIASRDGARIEYDLPAGENQRWWNFYGDGGY